MTQARFSRIELAIGAQALSLLQESTVVVVGLGGVGGIAAENLVRSGIGHMRIVDSDHIQETDFNRQMIALESTKGMAKVEAAEARLLDINPEVKIDSFQTFFHKDTAEKILTPPVTFVLDAIDSVLPKIELLAYCHKHSIPVISVMGAAFRIDYSKVEIADISKTIGCPLARVIRRRLRRRGISEGIPTVFSSEPGPPFVLPEEIDDPTQRSVQTRGRERHVIGSMGPMISIFGLLAAHYIICKIADVSEFARYHNR